MIIDPTDKRIRFTGRWNVCEKEAVTTANGSYFEFCYVGETSVIGINIDGCVEPFPHIYISVDNGANIEVPIQRYLRISDKRGKHRVRVIMKSSVETQERWYAPLASKVAVTGIEADDFSVLEEDKRKIIEFLGDSITEGIAVDTSYKYYKTNSDMVFRNDSTATYAWLTAEALNLRPVIMGYGCIGVTSKGAGNVPTVCNSYDFYSDGNPMKSNNCDYVVINHGTNDRQAEIDDFKGSYFRLLKIARKRNPKAKIISLTPFCGELVFEIEETVKKYNKEFSDDVFFIDSSGWISPEPLHPTREGHKIVSEKLVEILKTLINRT